MKKTPLALAVATALALMLPACGGSDETTEVPTSANGQKPEKTSKVADATKPAASNDNLPKLKCPAKVKNDLPGPDIIGIKLGMSQAEALNIVRCHTKDTAHVSLQGRWFDNLRSHSLKLENQAFSAQRGDTSECSYRSFSEMQQCGVGNRVWNHVAEKITVATPGVPGRETVVAVWRSQTFKEGEMPARESVVAALTEKYGAIQFEQKSGSRHHNVFWGADAGGNRLADNHPLFGPCVTGGVRANGGAIWRAGCGISIAAQVVASPNNPNLVQELHIGMLHQDDLWNYGEALQVELDQIEQKRQQEELERARGSGTEVQL